MPHIHPCLRTLRNFFAIPFWMLVMSPSFLEAGISVAPTVTELSLEPGQTYQGQYQVTNTGEKAIKVSVQAEDWMARLFGEPIEMAVEEWLTFEPSEQEIGPGETRPFQVTAKAPQDFKTEKVAQVFFTTQEYTNVRTRIGVIFYISPKGAETLTAEIISLAAQVIPAQENVPSQIQVEFEIKNSSNVHIRPRGSVHILNPASREPVQEWLLDKVPGVYPGRTFQWREYKELGGLEPGKYEVLMTLDYGYTYGKSLLMEKKATLDWQPKEVGTS